MTQRLLSVVIRQENGEIIKMARSTGSYQWLFVMNEFLNGNYQNAIDLYCESSVLFQKDWIANSGTKNFLYSNTPKLGCWNLFAPMDYGLLVIDFQDKNIFYNRHGNEYDYIDIPSKINIYNILSISYLDDSPSQNRMTYSIIKAIEQNLLFIEHQGKHYGLKDFFGSTSPHEICKIMHAKVYYNKKCGGVLDTIHNQDMEQDPPLLVSYEALDFKLHEFPDDLEGDLSFIQALKTNGFELNPEDKTCWKISANERLFDLVDAELISEIAHLSPQEQALWLQEEEKKISEKLDNLLQ